MIIAHSKADVVEYMGIITSHMIENPVLIDKYMMGTEVEVDAICDGEDFLIPGYHGAYRARRRSFGRLDFDIILHSTSPSV